MKGEKLRESIEKFLQMLKAVYRSGDAAWMARQTLDLMRWEQAERLNELAWSAAYQSITAECDFIPGPASLKDYILRAQIKLESSKERGVLLFTIDGRTNVKFFELATGPPDAPKFASDVDIFIPHAEMRYEQNVTIDEARRTFAEGFLQAGGNVNSSLFAYIAKALGLNAEQLRNEIEKGGVPF